MPPTATAWFSSVARASGNALAHPDALRRLIEAALPDRESALMDVAFKAKFLVRTWDVMKKPGTPDAARDKLKSVFHDEMEQVRALLQMLSARMPDAGRREFESTFLAIDGAAFVRLLEFLHDCSWIKNAEIDGRA